MRLVIDPDHLRHDMLVRRSATDMKLPMDDPLKVHIVTRRAELLADFSITAAGWIILLHACTADPADRWEFDALLDDVVAFKEWADQGLVDLGAVEPPDAAHVPRMPDDPKLVDSMRKLLARAGENGGAQRPHHPGARS